MSFFAPAKKTTAKTLMKGLRKITKKSPAAIKKALKGTKFAQHPELSLSRNEMKKIVKQLKENQPEFKFKELETKKLKSFLKKEKLAADKAHREEIARRNINLELSKEAAKQLEEIGLGLSTRRHFESRKEQVIKRLKKNAEHENGQKNEKEKQPSGKTNRETKKTEASKEGSTAGRSSYTVPTVGSIADTEEYPTVHSATGSEKFYTQKRAPEKKLSSTQISKKTADRNEPKDIFLDEQNLPDTEKIEDLPID